MAAEPGGIFSDCWPYGPLEGPVLFFPESRQGSEISQITFLGKKIHVTKKNFFFRKVFVLSQNRL